MKNVLFIIGALFLCACNLPENTTCGESQWIEFSWLIGEWSNIGDTMSSYEVWEKSNDSLLIGSSFTLVNQDTVFRETIIIKREGKDILYIPTIPGLLKDETTPFRMISKVEGEHYVFENTNHDFPQRIGYFLINTDSLIAYIEGEENGKFKKQIFPYKRID